MTSRLSMILISSTLLATPAFAQTTLPSASAAASGRFVTEQSTGQWRASKLIGVDVYSAQNEKVGDINEVLVDSTGAAQSVVIGVGGFLGIGEKNVAVPYGSLEWVNQDVRSSAAATNAPTNTASTATNVANSVSNTVNSGANTLAAGTAGTASVQARTPEQTAAYNGYPNHAVLRVSKAELQNAPSFRYYADRDDVRPTLAPNAPNAPATRQ